MQERMGFRNGPAPKPRRRIKDSFEQIGEDLVGIAERCKKGGFSLAFGLTAPQVLMPNGDVQGSKWAVCTIGDFMSLRGVTREIERDIDESLEEHQLGSAGEEHEIIHPGYEEEGDTD